MFNSMFKPVVKVVSKIDKTNDLFKMLDDLTKLDVLVGVPQQKASRRTEEVNNAELAYLHTNGCPHRNIPPRPFLIPALNAHQKEIAEQQGRILKALFSASSNNATLGPASVGSQGKVMVEMKKLGMMGQNYVKGWFVDPANGWPPNAPATIARKGSDRPLIDTAQLRNSITYVIRNKKADATD